MSQIQTIMMTTQEAREVVAQIRQGVTEIGNLLLDFQDREGWKALGYNSWRECAMVEFDFSQSRVYQLLSHAKVVKNIANSTTVEKPTSERQTRPLSDLSPEQQGPAWTEAQRQAGTTQPTGPQVKKIVGNFNPVPKPSQKPKLSTSGDFSHGPGIDAEFDGADDDLARLRIRLEDAGFFVASPGEVMGEKCPCCGRLYTLYTG